MQFSTILVSFHFYLCHSCKRQFEVLSSQRLKCQPSVFILYLASTWYGTNAVNIGKSYSSIEREREGGQRIIDALVCGALQVSQIWMDTGREHFSRKVKSGTIMYKLQSY